MTLGLPCTTVLYSAAASSLACIILLFHALLTSVLQRIPNFSRILLHLDETIEHGLSLLCQGVTEWFLFHPIQTVLEYIARPDRSASSISHRRMQCGSLVLRAVGSHVQDIGIIEDRFSRCTSKASAELEGIHELTF